jgi:hypothetical protein
MARVTCTIQNYRDSGWSDGGKWHLLLRADAEEWLDREQAKDDVAHWIKTQMQLERVPVLIAENASGCGKTRFLVELVPLLRRLGGETYKVWGVYTCAISNGSGGQGDGGPWLAGPFSWLMNCPDKFACLLVLARALLGMTVSELIIQGRLPHDPTSHFGGLWT